jgi:hypothetical protein
MLEINARPGRDLRAAIDRIGESRLCFELNIHPKTLYRWKTGRVPIPGRQHLAIKMLLGDLPGTDGQWTGWGFVRGELVSPGGDRFQPGQILALILLRQQLTAQRQEIERLQIKLAIAEQAVEQLAPAANDSRAWG